MSFINVIGLGYIGLPTALMLSKSGYEVVGTDIDQELISTLNSGNITFEEKGLKDLFQIASSNGIEFTTEYIETDLYIIAVPTPYLEDSKKLDPTYVINAIDSILDYCKKETIIIIESTMTPGSIDKFIRPVIKKRNNLNKYINLVHAPERIIPGNMIYELKNNPRTIGTDSIEIGRRIKEIYQGFCKGEISITDIRTAEMSKVVENTYRDVNIAFANELAKICRSDNMDVYEIIKLANKHPRVNILQPGPGVGGHCIPVDPWFLVGDYPGLVNIILTARQINDSMPEHVLSRIRTIMNEHDIKDVSKVGLYGLTYKENVDDVRESPTLQLLKRMDDHLAFGVKVFDPFVERKIVENQYIDYDEFLNEIDILVIMVSHDHFLENLNKVSNKLILDTKNICFIENTYKL